MSCSDIEEQTSRMLKLVKVSLPSSSRLFPLAFHLTNFKMS